jgi:hypothetical protein
MKIGLTICYRLHCHTSDSINWNPIMRCHLGSVCNILYKKNGIYDICTWITSCVDCFIRNTWIVMYDYRVFKDIYHFTRFINIIFENSVTHARRLIMLHNFIATYAVSKSTIGIYAVKKWPKNNVVRIVFCGWLDKYEGWRVWQLVCFRGVSYASMMV